MNTYQVAFFIGLFGSVHCIAMCGPLAFAIPFSGRGRWQLVWDKLIYQFGRIVSYSLIGIIIGFVGKQLWLAGLQEWVSIISGLLIIMAACSRLFKIAAFNSSWALQWSALVNKLLTYAIKHRAGHFYIGILNGFIPCGFVYLALVGAINTNSVTASAQYMFWFGMGTLPLMLAATLGAGLLTQKFRMSINRVVPYFMLLIGIWFVIRGLALGIPYLSPAEMGAEPICR